MSTPIFDDDYKGPRWTYGFTYRPPAFTHNPPDCIINSDREHPMFRYGTLDFPRCLTPEGVYSFELTRVVDGEDDLIEQIESTLIEGNAAAYELVRLEIIEEHGYDIFRDLQERAFKSLSEVKK